MKRVKLRAFHCFKCKRISIVEYRKAKYDIQTLNFGKNYCWCECYGHYAYRSKILINDINA